MSYQEDAQSDAFEMVKNFRDEIVERLCDDNRASEDFNNDYPNGDCYHHENHIDKEYDLEEAGKLLRELSDHEETDSGLWEGLEPQQAISAQAAYTYGNAVASEWSDLIEEINRKWSDDAEYALAKIEAGWESLCDDLDLPKDFQPMIDVAALKNKIAEFVVDSIIDS